MRNKWWYLDIENIKNLAKFIFINKYNFIGITYIISGDEMFALIVLIVFSVFGYFKYLQIDEDE